MPATADVVPLAPTTVPHLLAKRIVATAAKTCPPVTDLATAISEVELRTQISGASTLTLTIIDPDWVIFTSGFLDQNEDGLLDPIEVEFPDESGSFWRLCTVDITTDTAAPNLTLTFEDRIIAYLRDHWGAKTAAPGTKTRAQFIKSLVDEVGRGGDVPKITFVCPELHKVQPVEQDPATDTTTQTVQTPAGQASTKTKSAGQSQDAADKVNKRKGIGDGAQITVKGQPPTRFALQNVNDLLSVADELNAGQVATEALICAGIGESTMGADPNTFRNKYQGVLQGDPAQIDVHDAKALARAFLQGGHGFQGGGAIALSRTVSSPGQIATTVEASGKPADFYGTWLDEARLIIAAGGGATGGSQDSDGPPKSDVGQLTRGTTDNPDEDSWDCISRLAQDVSWFAFSNANTLYYMTGPDLIAQKPALYLNRQIDRHRARIASLTGTFDNTSFVYTRKKNGKGKKTGPRVSKPATPAQVRLNLVCDIDDYRAGDVFVLHSSGSINGRWIVSDATRRCLTDTFTAFTLEPPTAPTAEPQASDSTDKKNADDPQTGNGSIAGAAKQALAEKDKYVYREVRPIPDSLFGPAPRIMDCSGFATLCYKHAGAPDPNGTGYNGSGNTGTLIAHCKKVSADKAAPGDLCFYGGTPAFPAHVTVYIGNGQVISMGKQGDPSQGPAAQMGPAGFLGYYRVDPSK
jgi:cell wall-associated NlpC family hydrolase